MKRERQLQLLFLAWLVPAALAVSEGAGAREIAREGFEQVQGLAQAGQTVGRDGAGWTQPALEFDAAPALSVDLAATPTASPRGSISFDLKRKNVTLDRGRRTVFELLDDRGESVILAQWEWVSGQGPAVPVLRFAGKGYIENGLGLWGLAVPLDKEIPPEQWVHVDITWDDPSREYGVYVDGRKQALPAGEEWDFRPAANRYNEAGGLPLRFQSLPFGTLISRVATIRLGVHTSAANSNNGTSPLAHAVLDNFVVTVDEPLESLHTPGHDVKGLAGEHTKEGIVLTWAPPEIHGVNQLYIVYRRSGAEGNARFTSLTPDGVRDLRFLDATAVAGETYRYSVTSVYGDLKGGTLEGQYPPEVTVTAAALAIDSVAAEKALYGAGQEIVVTLRGTKDLQASFQVAKAPAVAMEEVDDGVYVGRGKVPDSVNAAQAPLTGTLIDPATKETVTKAGLPLAIDTTAPEGVPRLIATAPWGGEVSVTWDASPSADIDHYAVYRGEGKPPTWQQGQGEPYAAVKGLELVDTRVVAGLEYLYAIVAVDKAGNPGPASVIVGAKAVAGDGPRVSAIAIEPAGKPVKPGETLTVTAVGQSGGQMSADIEGLAAGAGLALTEQGRSGRYAGTYVVKETDMAATKAAHRLIAHLTDAYGTSDQAGPELWIVGQDSRNDQTPPAIAKISHNAFQAVGISGKLVAGDTLSVTLEGEPGGYAAFDLTGVAKAVAMKETAAGSGVYQGTYTVPWGASGEKLLVTGHLVDDAGNETILAAEGEITLDTEVRLTVTAGETLLPADRKSQAKITARATDANGKGLADHELALTLSTTEEYTGVVGGGSVEGKQAAKEDQDNLEIRWGGKTDGFGEVSAGYTAGFAAKTALIVAKDLTTGDVGAGWLNTYIAAQIAIQLVPRNQKGTEDRAILRLAADPGKLTADGRSTSRIRAWLTDLKGIPLAGKTIAFALAGPNGTLKLLQATTDARGMAQAEYRAGTAMGTVTVTASSQEYGVTGSIPIILMSDAPAKILIAAKPGKLPADGTSQAQIAVRVTDIHDNPNQQAPVTFKILQGEGNLATDAKLTDRNGETDTAFTAGTKAGVAIVEARYTSRAPTEEELRRVYGTIFVPKWYDRQERDRVKLVEWLVEPGEKVEKGQILVTLDTKDGEKTLLALEKGTFVRKVKHERDDVQPGETLGYVELETRD